MQSVDRIWFERGEWKDISEKSLMASIKRRQQQPELEGDDDEEEQQIHAENALPTHALPPGFDIAKLRESVINKLFHAKSEIDVALDVINILAAGNRGSSSAAVKDLVLPAGSLTATYVTKPKQTTKAQLESVQLNLGLKRKKQKQASEFLKKSAAALKRLVEKEQVFWDEALDLRRNNWHMQANSNAGASFFVQYGYTEVGSDFNEQSVGELKRSEDDSEQDLLQMSLPHGTCRKVAVRISQSHMGKLGLGGQNEFSEGILGILEGGEEEEQQGAYADQDEEKRGTCKQGKQGVHAVKAAVGTMHSKIQNQLAEAHATVFDAELFSNILAEAQALNSNVRFPDDEIVINIDGQIDLHVAKVPVLASTAAASSTTTTLTSQQIISRSIDLSFRLLLLQHQRFNLWKTKARTLSSNHKIHQLLQSDTAVASSTASSAATPTAATNAPTPTQSGNGATGTPAPTPTTAASGNVLPVVGTNGSVATATSRARTRLAMAANSTATAARDLPKHIPILLPLMSLTRFWVQFDRIRHVTNKIIREYRHLAIAVHYTFADDQTQQPSKAARPYDTYPGYGQVALCLGLGILRGQQLWQVDQVDEAIHGSIWWQQQQSMPHWRTITVRLLNSHLEFKLSSSHEVQDTAVYTLELNHTITPMHFKERVCVIIKQLTLDAQNEKGRQ
ncbi:hypothetical protein MUCCIDRAFT_162495 [Mucor lusitanicus CBS 277.49]|uniref:Mediator of RNA polymerase II transcription subunit 17 n=1 Tax=Mucor lusitanicus CBS 277.49 TaxID=747725 RepID=A0A162T9H0_MUCCL|nr:hypothetical protein MUCCIDRAFT_162495 [Mucor lusitanicus CBS 277.49]